MKIISGAQTGVDRAALDVALKHGIECGGWCPTGRLDEFGRIPDHYPVRELDRGSFAERTLQNVKDSDATVIICFGEPRGGTQFTIECCGRLDRPHNIIDAGKTSPEEAARVIGNFMRQHTIDILNVAGPRQSEWPGGYDFAVAALNIFLNSIMSTRTSMSKNKNRITRSAELSPGRDARRSRRVSRRRANKSKTR
ncbi:MAG: putative molybdenum carrier protein [Chthoniobacterales bacterium]